jgi:hypothetical protein
MQPKGRRPATKKKRGVSHAASLKKYTEEERQEQEKKHVPVERERFENILRRLVRVSPRARRE